MKTEAFGIGLIGIGGFGKNYVGALRGMPRAKIAGVCDTNVKAAEELAAQCGAPPATADYHALLAMPGVDAVFIATPHFLHHQMTMAALAAGKHVFCEKPLATTAADADEMARTARKNGLVLSCHFNQRQSKNVKLLRHIVRTNLIGTVYHVNMRWRARWTAFMFGQQTGWRVVKQQAGGGIFIGRGSHLIDAAWYILGQPRITKIHASCRNDLAGFEVDDFATALLTCANGVTIAIEASYVLGLPHCRDNMEYEVFGTGGGASFVKTDQHEVFGVGRLNLKTGAWEDLAGALDAAAAEREGVASVIGDFVGAVLEQREPCITGEDAAYVSTLLEAGYASSAAHAPVDIA